jgi:hypothetical protein
VLTNPPEDTYPTVANGVLLQALKDNDPNRKRVTIRDVRLELLELQPYPWSSRRTDPTEYRATLRGSRE